MRIYFERSGGTAGVRLTAEIDTEQRRLVYGPKSVERSLSPDELHEAVDLLNRVKAAGLLTYPAASSSTRPPDQFQYVLTVEEGGRRSALPTSEGSAPSELEALLRYLTRLSMGRMGGSDKP
jgi:hypothetical protein